MKLSGGKAFADPCERRLMLDFQHGSLFLFLSFGWADTLNASSARHYSLAPASAFL
jgi:hypothetical protein